MNVLSGARAGLGEETTETHPIQDLSLSFDHIKGLSDAGEVLDPQARAAYKQRLTELREELEEARDFHDLGRSEQLAAALDLPTHELARAVSLDGQARRAASPAERARVNITRAVKIALRKITAHHPALGQHLATHQNGRLLFVHAGYSPARHVAGIDTVRKDREKRQRPPHSSLSLSSISVSVSLPAALFLTPLQ